VQCPSIAGLVPAAGASRRLGQDKRRLPYRGATLLEHTVDVLRCAGCQPLVVVLEPASPCRSLPGLSDAILVENPAPERGMLSSIREGLSAVPAEAPGVAVLPGDHPFVTVEAARALLERFRQTRPGLLVPSYGGRRGHPLLMGRELFEAACACDEAIGLRQLLELRAAALEVLELPASPAEQDVDVPEDLERLR
jgi:CTP:molybdopterin cytidylyltransferase MocA